MGGKGIVWRSIVTLTGLTLALVAVEGRAQQPGAAGAVTYAAQGWSAADRETFYTTSQGSHLMPAYPWFKALRRTDVDELHPPLTSCCATAISPGRLSPPANPEGLPIGFVIDGPTATGQLGLTCAACHTGQLEYTQGGVTRAVRLDGAPAKTDAQQFLTDLLAASRATLAEPGRFDAFAMAIFGPGYTVAKAAQVKDGLGKWVAQFGEFMDISLPAATPWGPGRLDAFGMIFNPIARAISEFETISRLPTRRCDTRSYGMPRSKIAPNGTAASRTDSTFERSDAIPARSLEFSLILPRIASPCKRRSLPPSSTSRIIPSTLPDCRRWRRRSPSCARRLGRERYSALTSDWRRPANRCLTQIAAAAMRGKGRFPLAGSLADPGRRRRHGPEDADQFGTHIRPRAASGRPNAATGRWRPD